MIIAESPGRSIYKNNLKGFYKTCGLIDELKGLDVEFNYDTSETKVQNDNAIYLKKYEYYKSNNKSRPCYKFMQIKDTIRWQNTQVV